MNAQFPDYGDKVQSSLENIVAVSQATPSYEERSSAEADQRATSTETALRDLFRVWRLDAGRHDSAGWNPLSAFIPAGSKIVIKPNWVYHKNASGAGLECLITHTSLIESVAKYAALTHPSQLTVGDAPIQACDFEELRRLAGIDEMVARLRRYGLEVAISDFRRTILHGTSLADKRSENNRDLKQFVLFDLGKESLLEGLHDANKFRVTMYNPDFLHRTHSQGRHQYLIAKDVIEANIVINLPKLKSHKKACITGALKNLIGINGNKEYLPHHRKGGSTSGGDCYVGSPIWKRATEDLLDAANRREPSTTQATLAWMAGTAQRIAAKLGADENLEGSWHGNDTIWRTCLDLQRILRYGRADGTLSLSPERTVISITDAIIGGEGEGPLANTPIPSGFLTGAINPAAAEWVHARLMGFDPEKIPLIREAFGPFTYPLADFSPRSVRVWMAGAEKQADDILPLGGRAFLPPRGWRGHCELNGTNLLPAPPSTGPQYISIDE